MSEVPPRRYPREFENVNTIRTGGQAFGTSFPYPHHLAPEQKWPRILSSSLLYMYKCDMVQPFPKKYRGWGESGTRASLDVTNRIFSVPCSPLIRCSEHSVHCGIWETGEHPVNECAVYRSQLEEDLLGEMHAVYAMPNCRRLPSCEPTYLSVQRTKIII